VPRTYELSLIVLVLLGTYLLDPWPVQLGAGQFVLIVAVYFLGQTLIRDLYLYYKLKSRVAGPPNGKASQCFCVESGIGIGAVIVGLILFTGSLGGSLKLAPWHWTLTIGGLMTLNYLLKDFVFSWKPWRIYRDPDHLNIVPRLKS
jgi:hypothetical protein